MAEYKGRGIHDESLYKSFKDGGRYENLMNLVREDEELDFEIRNNYVNIYYEGCNIAKISSAIGSVQFDKFYFLLRKDIKGNKPSKKEVQENCNKGEVHYDLYMDLIEKQKSLTDLFKDKKYSKYIDEAKCQVKEWFDSWELNKEEKSTQQKIVRANNESTTLCVIDNEYQISTDAPFKFVADDSCEYEHKSPRFDLIAVDKNGQIYVIELKKGLSACCGKAGLRSHAESFRCTIERDSKYFVEEMKSILEQKKELGLIDDSIKINDNKPKFVFAYETKDGEPIEAFYKKCVEEGVGNFNIYICEDSVLKPYNK